MNSIERLVTVLTDVCTDAPKPNHSLEIGHKQSVKTANSDTVYAIIRAFGASNFSLKTPLPRFFPDT
jgi:hypothetical protein